MAPIQKQFVPRISVQPIELGNSAYYTIPLANRLSDPDRLFSLDSQKPNFVVLLSLSDDNVLQKRPDGTYTEISISPARLSRDGSEIKVTTYPWPVEAQFVPRQNICSFIVATESVIWADKSSQILELFESAGPDASRYVFGRLGDLSSQPAPDRFSFFMQDLRPSDRKDFYEVLDKIFNSTSLDPFGNPLNSGSVTLSIPPRLLP